MEIIVGFETLEDLLDVNLEDPTEEAIAEGLPTETTFPGGNVRFLKIGNGVKIDLPEGAVEVQMPSWSQYSLFTLPKCEVKAKYSIECVGEERLLWDQQSTMAVYKKDIQSVFIKAV